MASVEKNGQPSMEEILASIRRIVADDPSGAAPLIDLNRKPIGQNTPSASDGVGVDDSPDFELPSMFRAESRPARPGTLVGKLAAKSKSAPIGRLTDAIRNVGPKVAAVSNSLNHTQPQTQTPQTQAPQTQNRQPNTQQGDANFGTRPKSAQSLSSLEPNGEVEQNMDNGTVTSLHNGVRSGVGSTVNGSTADLNTVHHISEAERRDQTSTVGQADPAQAHTRPQSNTSQQTAPAQMAASKPVSNPPRVMAPFRDTRMSMMGPTSGAKSVEVQTQEPVQTETTTDANSDIGSIVPSAMDLPGRGHGGPTDAINGSGAIASEHAEVNSAAVSSAEAPQHTAATAADRGGSVQASGIQAPGADANPPPLPEGSDTSAPQQIEDATADLLRPMLRQWLTDNMPRMVEKALHIEVAETVRTGKPTDGS